MIDLSPDRDLPPCDDDDFALFAADVVTQSVDCPADFQSGEEALPSMLRLGDSQDDGLTIDGITHGTSSSNVDMLARQADVQTNPPSREVSTAAWLPLRPRGFKAWRRKVALVWRYHSIWHHSKEHMEQHLAGSDADNHSLERGDSRYFVWRCN